MDGSPYGLGSDCDDLPFVEMRWTRTAGGIVKFQYPLPKTGPKAQKARRLPGPTYVARSSQTALK